MPPIMSGVGFNFHGQSAAMLPALRSYRDALTERFLRSDAPGIGRLHFDAPDDAGRKGLVGFGVSIADKHPPSIVIFAEQEGPGLRAMRDAIGAYGIPVDLVQNVRFESAASRPVAGGDCIGRGSAGGDTGTLGCVVSDEQGVRYGLTCNHVIADLNAAAKGSTAVWAPGAGGGGGAADRLGVVHDFEDIDFRPGAMNVIDAALVKPDHAADLDPVIRAMGCVAGVNNALPFGAAVQKTGYVTSHTAGYYWYQINAMITYRGGLRSALFRDMLGIVGASGIFASQGDSGALVLDSAGQAAGMLVSVASGLNLTLAAPIRPTLSHFKVTIV